MNNILSIKQAYQISKILREKKNQIVLAGGCFDILHIGHLTFLEKAKKSGDVLIILIESDEIITQTKGIGRPINPQHHRAKILASLAIVDYVILLQPDMKNSDYDAIVLGIKPAIIATTKGDDNKYHKQRQADQIGAKVIEVSEQIKDQSTTRLIKIFNEL